MVIGDLRRGERGSINRDLRNLAAELVESLRLIGSGAEAAHVQISRGAGPVYRLADHLAERLLLSIEEEQAAVPIVAILEFRHDMHPLVLQPSGRLDSPDIGVTA